MQPEELAAEIAAQRRLPGSPRPATTDIVMVLLSNEHLLCLPQPGELAAQVAGREASAAQPSNRRFLVLLQPGELAAEIAAGEASAAEPKAGDKRPAGWDIASMAPKQKVKRNARGSFTKLTICLVC